MHEELAAVVFQRTALANETLSKTPDAVPLQLRTLLLAVDGRASVAQYVPFLSNLVPLTPKLQQLEKQGFLHRRPASGQPTAPAAASSRERSTPNPSDTMAETLDADTLQSIETAFQRPSTHSVAELSSFDAELERLARQMGQAASQPATLPTGACNSSGKSTLDNLLLDMERFIGSLPGLDGLPVALMLEQIRSPQQLALELDDYSEWLEPHGQRAEAHVQHIRAQLRRLGY